MPIGGARARVDDDRTVVLAQPLRGEADAGLFAALTPALYLVDGNNLLWRAAHAPPAPFSAADGRDLTPLFRFFTMLRRSVGTYGLFAECVVCFDGPEAWTSRVAMDPLYKSNRRYEDVDLSFMEWMPEIRAALRSAGVEWVEIIDREADDVIATLTAQAVADGRSVRIVSTDRDYFQLLGPHVTIVSSKTTPNLVDAEWLVAAYGVEPSRWCDLRALAGDPSDGIPGLPGIGLKRAAAMLQDPRPVRDLVEAERREAVLRWHDLMRLDTRVDVPAVVTGEATPKLPSAVTVCRKLGLI